MCRRCTSYWYYVIGTSPRSARSKLRFLSFCDQNPWKDVKISIVFFRICIHGWLKFPSKIKKNKGDRNFKFWEMCLAGFLFENMTTVNVRVISHFRVRVFIKCASFWTFLRIAFGRKEGVLLFESQLDQLRFRTEFCAICLRHSCACVGWWSCHSVRVCLP